MSVELTKRSINRLKLKGLINTRDLGGIPTMDGKSIKYAQLIRSGKLYKLHKQTINNLHKLGLKKVIDLRIDTEIDNEPDTLIKGVEYVRIPLLCTATLGITRQKSMRRVMTNESKIVKKEYGSSDKYMISMYEKMLFSYQSKQMLKKFLREVIETDGCVLWHCSAGKDRAGICTMLLEGLLGVDEQMIILDYTFSQIFQRKKRLWQKIGLFIVPISRSFRRILFAMMNAKPRYIISVIDSINEHFGTIEAFCRKELEISENDIQILKNKYLERQ